MSAIRLSREEANELLSNRRFELCELAIVIGEGNLEPINDELPTSYFDLASELLETDLPGYIAATDLGIPTILSTWDDTSICPSSITIRTCSEWISLPVFNHSAISTEIQNILEAIPAHGTDGYPTDPDEQDKLWSQIAANYKFRALGWLSSYLAREPGGFAPGWIGFAMSRINGDEATYCQVIVTSPGTDGSSHVFSWNKYWNALDEHEGPYSHTIWSNNSTIEVISRDNDAQTVDFKFVDDDGFEIFRTSAENLNQLWNTLSQWGWNFIESSNNSTVIKSTNTFGTTTIGQGDHQQTKHQRLVSPTPNVRPTQQRGGAQINSGIVQGDIHATGLLQVNGIVQGNVLVPPGSDVNVNGIVQGTVSVYGGTARLYGTIAAASISSGRLEVYGILQTPLQYASGEVYYDPNSLIAQ